MKRQFAVTTRFAFTGTFYINAASKAEAKEFVENHCGLVIGGTIHSTLPGDEVDWDFPVHPDKVIGRITLKGKRGV
jgi:hypothetical protein